MEKRKEQSFRLLVTQIEEKKDQDLGFSDLQKILSHKEETFLIVDIFLEQNDTFGCFYLLNEEKIFYYKSEKMPISKFCDELSFAQTRNSFFNSLSSNMTAAKDYLKDGVSAVKDGIVPVFDFLAKGKAEEAKNKLLAENLEKKEQKILQLRQEKKEQQEVSENKLTELRKELKEQKQAFEKQQKENQLKFEKKLEECFQKLLDEKDARILEKNQRIN